MARSNNNENNESLEDVIGNELMEVVTIKEVKKRAEKTPTDPLVEDFYQSKIDEEYQDYTPDQQKATRLLDSEDIFEYTGGLQKFLGEDLPKLEETARNNLRNKLKDNLELAVNNYFHQIDSNAQNGESKIQGAYELLLDMPFFDDKFYSIKESLESENNEKIRDAYANTFGTKEKQNSIKTGSINTEKLKVLAASYFSRKGSQYVTENELTTQDGKPSYNKIKDHIKQKVSELEDAEKEKVAERFMKNYIGKD